MERGGEPQGMEQQQRPAGLPPPGVEGGLGAAADAAAGPAAGEGPFRAEDLRRDVLALGGAIGERNLRDPQRVRRLKMARDYVLERLEEAGCPVRLERYEAGGERVENLVAEVPGATHPDEVVLVGAHYDTAKGSPGANDNASGVAALLSFAAALTRPGAQPASTVRLVAFCTEEPPFTRTPEMGSWVHAQRCRERGDRLRAMLSLETLGSYARSHRWPQGPFPFNKAAPVKADFFAVVGNLASRGLVRRCVQAFPQGLGVRCRGAVLPGSLPGVKSSDHWSFWKQGYPAVMVTDTAFLRTRHYHQPTDRPEAVNLPMLARVSGGLYQVVRTLAG
jgi:hypothetical protein